MLSKKLSKILILLSLKIMAQMPEDLVSMRPNFSIRMSMITSRQVFRVKLKRKSHVLNVILSVILNVILKSLLVGGGGEW